MSLCSLPIELLVNLGYHCDRQQLASLARVNRGLYAIFNPLLYRDSIHNDTPSKTCVTWAVEHGSLNTLKHAIAQGADINGSCAADNMFIDDGISSTPLHIATKNGFHEIVQWLLDNGAYLNAPSFLLCNCDAFGSYVGGILWYPLHFAICHSDEAMVRLFLQKGAYFSSNKTPGLRCAILNELHNVIDMLTQQPSFDPHFRDASELCALHYVADVKDPVVGRQIVHKLVDHGVPMDVMGLDMTPLAMLILAAKYKPAIALLERGADPCVDTNNDKRRALDCCFHGIYCPSGDESEPEAEMLKRRADRRRLVRLLIEKGANVNRASKIMGREYLTPLFWALMDSRDVECVRLLLDAGASIEDAITYADRPGSEPLLSRFFAQVAHVYPYHQRPGGPDQELFEHSKESVRLLLESGARIDSVDGEQSALGISCQLATSGMGTRALEFLVNNSTSRNVTVEFVEALAKDAKRKAVFALLDQLRDKLTGEELESFFL